MGPNANDSVMQWGNYNGTPAYTKTILQGIKDKVGNEDEVFYVPGCSWVERTLIHSVYDLCKSENGKGFTATYWNNTNFEGDPVTTMQLENPFNLCTMGATVFAPGVNLTDFSAIYKSVFTPKVSGDVIVEMYTCGAGDLLINGEKVKDIKLKIKKDGLVDKFIRSLPFELTNAQKLALDEIIKDLNSTTPMQKQRQMQRRTGMTLT